MNKTSYNKLDTAYYLQSNVVEIAHDLIGKFVVTDFEGHRTVGRIVETEAYDGRRDRACHAFEKCTKRTEVMYRAGGIAYIYLCYGIHHLFNIVTNVKGMADAILVRAVEPIEGRGYMIERRGIDRKDRLTAGPGVVSQAMGITTEHNGMPLTGNGFFLAYGDRLSNNIMSDRRVGVDYAGKDALLPWRFFDGDSKYVSKRVQKELVIK